MTNISEFATLRSYSALSDLVRIALKNSNPLYRYELEPRDRSRPPAEFGVLKIKTKPPLLTSMKLEVGGKKS